jgi:hypothetical protein
MCDLFVLPGRSYNNLMFMAPKVDASSCHGFQLMQDIIFLVRHFAMHFGGSLQCLHRNVVLFSCIASLLFPQIFCNFFPISFIVSIIHYIVNVL